MLKVMLVDDEPNVRQGVKMMIPWSELGLEVIAEGEDGDDGLNKILINNPDIVIADVKMPGMTGIRMLDAAQKSGFKGKALILSGYSDFTYAKEAISLGVKQFILKPVDEDELIKCLKTVRDEIISEKASVLQLQKGSEYISEQTIRGLLLGDMSMLNDADLSAYKAFDKFDTALISVVSPTLNDGKTALLDIIRRQISELGNVDVINVDLSGMLAVIFKNWNDGKIRDSLNKISRDYKGKIFITIGSTADRTDRISESYRTAHSLYENRFLYLHYGVVSPDIAAEMRDVSSQPAESFSKQFFTFMEINDIARLESCFDDFRNTLCRNFYTPEKIKVVCITTIIDIKNSIIKSVGEKKAEQFNDEMIISQIGAMNSLFEIIELMKRELIEISNTFYGRTTKSTMERVVRYIRANYSQELRLEMLANIFGYNSAYLGKVFHQYTGDNFNNYLDRIRITEAKRLLSTDEYKVYEVAEMVGYTNINYFHNKFKKYVGISPLNYKKECLNDSSADDEEQE